MRRSRRDYNSGLISDTWNYHLRTVEDSFGFSREFTNALNQEMLDGERIEREHIKRAEQGEEPLYPSCDLSDKPKDI